MATLRELYDADGAARADAPATAETQHTMAVGDVFLGNLSDPGDQDWVRVELQADTTYVMRLQGRGDNPVSDPLLELYDAEGERVAFNDDLVQGGSLDSKIVFTTPACTDSAEDNPTLVYYLNARSYSLNPALASAGDYRLSLMEQQPLAAPDTPPEEPDALFHPVPTVTGANDTHAGTGADDILEGGPGADTLDGRGQPEGGIGDTASYYYASDAVHVDLAAGRGYTGEAKGDTLIDIENLFGSRGPDTLTGDAGRNILVGAAGNDTLDGGPGADLLVGGAGTDTVTYRRAYSTHGVRVDLALGVADGSAAEGDTLIGIENIIGSLQDDALYGDDKANRLRGHAGDDLLAGRGGRDVFVYYPDGDHDTVLDFETGQDTLELHLYDVYRGYDWRELDIQTEGEDTVLRIDDDNSLTLSGVAPDELREKNFEFVREIRPVKQKSKQDDGDGDDGLTQPGPRLPGVTPGKTIIGTEETNTLTGTKDDDTLYGLGGDDTISALEGDDTLIGGPGKDTMDGGPGSDTARYENPPQSSADVGVAAAASSGITINLGGTKDGNGYITGKGGDAKGDKLKNIENLWGTPYDDILTGDSGNNVLWGRGGNDTLKGEGGNDILEGGPGADTLDGGSGSSDYAAYTESDAAVTLNLSTKTYTGGHADGDTLKNITNLLGSAHDDSLTGDGARNRLKGGPGADTLDGGGGAQDGAYYAESDKGVTVDLSSTPVNGYIIGKGGDAEGDKIKNIEYLQGSAHNDTLTGDDKNNVFWALAGNDTLDGGKGNDSLYGDDGDDTVKGGEGNDNLVGRAGADTLDGGDGAGDRAWYLWSPAGVTIDLGTTKNGYSIGKGGEAEGDKLKNIENLLGSDHDDTLTGDDKDNVLDGRRGNDTLNGGKGRDTLNGQPGDDTLRGGDGPDSLFGGTGNDTLMGGKGDDNLWGGAGADTLDGGDSAGDRAFYDKSSAGVTIDLGTTKDGYSTGKGGEAEGDKLKNIEYLRGSNHADTLTGDDNKNVFWGRNGKDTLTGGGGNDQLNGDDGDDTVNGGKGNDNLTGGKGNDTLKGGDGNDTLYGQAGDDTLTGGAGDDTFHFQSGYGSDKITDFTVDEDQIDLSAFLLSGINDSKLSITYGSNDTVITVDNNVTITLEGMTSTLDANDFIFS